MFVVVVDAVAVGAEDYAALFDFFVSGGKSFFVYKLVDALLVRVVGVYVVEIKYGGV